MDFTVIKTEPEDPLNATFDAQQHVMDSNIDCSSTQVKYENPCIGDECFHAENACTNENIHALKQEPIDCSIDPPDSCNSPLHESADVKEEMASDFLSRDSMETNDSQEPDRASGKLLFTCSECGKTFNKKSNLKRHEDVHQRLRKFDCHLCDKSFSQKINLDKHLIIHSGVKPFSCKTCGKDFFQKSNLVRHEKIHESPGSFKCDECGKHFKQKSELSQHEKTHSSFSCNLCSEVFDFKNGLTLHKKYIHNADKLYSCKVCGKAFQNKTYYTEHTRLHTLERPFMCSVCSHTFNNKSNLTKHERQLHGITSQWQIDNDHLYNKTSESSPEKSSSSSNLAASQECSSFSPDDVGSSASSGSVLIRTEESNQEKDEKREISFLAQKCPPPTNNADTDAPVMSKPDCQTKIRKKLEKPKTVRVIEDNILGVKLFWSGKKVKPIK